MIRNNNENMFLFSTDEIEVVSQIKKLQNRKSACYGYICNEILKICVDIISPFLSKLINIIFETGVYALQLKIARVIPISILNSTNKIIERSIRLLNFLDSENFFYKFQYGIRKKICLFLSK